MEMIIILGLVAAICTTASFLPQTIKTIKTKHIKSLSLSMYVVLTIGVFLWILYGILIKDLPLILANGLTFVFSAIILVMIIKHR